MPTITSAIQYGQEELVHLDNPTFEAQLILSTLLETNRSHIIAFSEQMLSPVIWEGYQVWVAKRKSGVPFAYLTGHKEFYGLLLTVTKDTLIPRDDTELIVHEALNKLKNHIRPSVLDLGTGTGAIALALKSQQPTAIITATDINPDTLLIAQHNAQQHKLTIELLLSSWFENIQGRTFDLILSNPPYIDPLDENLNNDGVRFEPKSALIAEKKGLADLYTIIDNAPQYLNKEGYLLLEHGYNQANDVQTHFTERGFIAVKTYQDYGGNDRVTEGKWPLAKKAQEAKAEKS